MRPSMQRIQRALLEIAPRIYAESLLLRDLCMLDIGVGVDPREIPIPSGDGGRWTQVHPGSRWGGYDQNVWFHAQIKIPEAWIAQLDGGEGGEGGETHAVVLRLMLGKGTEFGWPEGLLYVNGRLQQGINRHHPDVLLRTEDVRSGSLAFDVRAWSGMLPDDHRIETAEIALLDRPAEQLVHLLRAGADLVDALDTNDPLLYALADAVESGYDRVILSPAAFHDSVRVSLAYLEGALKELRRQYQPADRPIVTAVGHGHLDVAWLWQTRHTREKAARTFSIATALMDAYPEYVFLHTTPQVFAWLKTDYPELYERVRARIHDGRFEAAGAMWVESDCNLVSGESLVRQILYGRQFLREEFGQEYDALWLPDAFGYTAALPQIVLRSGIPIFMTTKLSWSETNRIPADTFNWRGIDGSTVLAHFITTPTLDAAPLFAKMDTYNGALNVAAVRGLWARYQQKSLNRETLLAYGHGDGGAGPTRQHLERARALQQLPGMPELRLGRADEFFQRLRATAAQATDLTTWDGDLYVEYHRGTFTTQSWLKRTHRQLEGALLDVEWLDAWQWARFPATTPNRREQLDTMWRTLLLHEFHDILPGSSISTVYWDARQALTALASDLATLRDEILGGLFAAEPANGTIVLNPSPLPRRDVLLLAEPASGGTPHVDGSPLAVQRVETSDGPALLVEVPALDGRSYCAVEWASAPSGKQQPRAETPDPPPVEVGEDESGFWLKNEMIAVRLTRDGEIASIRDSRVDGGRELLQPSKRANVLTAYEDLPREFDAWDIDDYYARKPYALEADAARIVERGPLRAVVHVERRFRSSTLAQDIILYRADPRIDFKTHIDWHEQHILLKAAFPLDLRAPRATCEVQFGAIERTTHRNTSWEKARFEIPAHRWIDLSEGGYGVSLLNDGRYGHDLSEGQIGLTLLRSPTWPDPQADQGEHEVVYSLYPHPGDWRSGGTVAAGYALNRPSVAFVPPSSGPQNSDALQVSSAIMFESRAENVVIEAIKRSQDGTSLVVRLYESTGSRARAAIYSALPLRMVVEADLLERPLTSEGTPAYALWQASASASHDAPEMNEHGWSCELRPFEIRTFLISLMQ
jgi:alpha-mannosidase